MSASRSTKYLAAILLTAGAWNGAAQIVIYQDGVIFAQCEPPVPVKADTTTLTYSYTTSTGDAPSDPKELYDHIVLEPGKIYFQINPEITPHHVEWFHGDQYMRRENYAPWNHRHDFDPGEYRIIAKIYSDDDVVAAQYSINITIAAPSASTGDSGYIRLLVEWTPPTDRVNGQPLQSDEISHYVLLGAGAEISFEGTATSGYIELPKGDYALSLIAVDTDGLSSDPSLPVKVSL